MKKPRVVIAGLAHETHTFLPGQTVLADCTISEGDELLALESDSSPMGGVLESARAMSWEVVPAVYVRAAPSEICADEIVEFWWQAMEVALQTPPDAVFLVLHGAMASVSWPDVEGEMLRRIRARVGPQVPIAGSTDLHANFSVTMAENSDCLVTYRRNPHTDARETAQRAALLLDFLMRNDERARTYFRALPILWPPTGTGTADSPMRELEALAREIEERNAQILAVNVHAGYSFADVPAAGVSFSVVSVGDEKRAQKALDKLEKCALANREQGNVIEFSFESLLPEIRRLLRESPGKPIALAEPSDNIGGGAPGDGTGLLREFIKHQIGNSAVVLADAKAVGELQKWQIGESRALEIGGASHFEGAGPLELEIELLGRSDGEFTLEDANSHLAAMFGSSIKMGPCATVRHVLPDSSAIQILLTSRKTPPFDLGQLRSQGITPEKLAVIGAKAAVAHRRAFEPIASALFSVATPGACASDLKTLPFVNVRRPIFPLDQL